MKGVLLILVGSLLFAGEPNIFYVAEGETLKEDVSLIGQSANVEGVIDGELAIINGDLNLRGTVKGDVAVIGGDCLLKENAWIKGELAVIGGKLTREKGSKIEGKIANIGLGPFKYFLKFIPKVETKPKEGEEIEGVPEKEEKRKQTPILSAIFILFWSIGVSLIVFFLLIFFPQNSETLKNRISEKPGISFLTGLGAQILFVPILLVLIISIIGIPLIPVFIILFVIALVFGLTGVGIFLGEQLNRSLKILPDRAFVLGTLGIFSLFLIWTIGEFLKVPGVPFSWMGTVISFVAFLLIYLAFTFGLGGCVLSRFGTR